MREVEFYGEKLQLAEAQDEFAFLEYSEAMADIEAGVTPTAGTSAAILRLVVSCLAEGEEARFRSIARKNRAKTESLVEVLKTALDAWAEESTDRPTGLPAASSDGQKSTEAKSESDVDKVVRAFPGRPDRQVGIMETLGIVETG